MVNGTGKFLHPQTGKSALHPGVEQAFQPAGKGDFLVALPGSNPWSTELESSATRRLESLRYLGGIFWRLAGRPAALAGPSVLMVMPLRSVVLSTR